MALVQAIKFRDLLAQLSSIETLSFVTDLASSDPQLIIRALTSRFICQSRSSDDDTENQNCNDILSKIIQSRDSDDNKSCDEKLDTLPRRVIGICSSFLDQTSYAALSVTNRSIYLGSNTPILLQELTVKYKSDSDHGLLDICKFQFAKKFILKVPLKDEDSRICDDLAISRYKMKIIASQIAKMSRLQALDLSDVHAEFIAIIANHETTNQRTKSLSVTLWESEIGDYDDEPYDRFVSSITDFKQLQFLKFRNQNDLNPDRYDDDEMMNRSLIESCSNLRGLDLDDRGYGIEYDVLQSIGHRLQYLFLYDRAGCFIHSVGEKKFDFNNLRELRQGSHCANDSLQTVLETSINLEKVELRGKSGNSDLCQQLLKQCERLRYLEVREFRNKDEVLQSLERSLFFNNTIHRDTLKIRINTSSWALERCEECILKLVRLSNALSLNPVDQWMLILYLRCSKMKSSFINDLRSALAASTSDLVVLHDRFDQIILITNSENPGSWTCRPFNFSKRQVFVNRHNFLVKHGS